MKQNLESLEATLQPHTHIDLVRQRVHPAGALSDPDRRRARLLSWVLLTLLVLTSVALLAVLLVDSADNPRRSEYIVLITGLMALLVIANGLNRAGLYALSAGLTVAAAALGPWGSVILDPTILQGDFVPLTYVALSVLLCSLLLSLRVTIVIGIIQFLGLAILPFIAIATDSINWPSLLIFIVSTAVLGVAANYFSRKDLEQIDRQTFLLTEDRAQLQSILDNSTAIIYLKDTGGRFLLVNRQYETVHHMDRSQVVGKTEEELLPGGIGRVDWSNDQKALMTNMPVEMEETLLQADGMHTYISVRFILQDPLGQPYAVCCQSTDITERKAIEEALRHQSVRDPLTGLFNRRYLEETLEREVRRSERSRNPVGIIMLDIDHFKQINDTTGHGAGDALLRQVGPFLRKSLRAGDMVCRYGGDEFILVLPETSAETALERAESLRKEAKRIPVEYDNRSVKQLTLSVGVAVYPIHGSGSDDIIRAADAALYRAKNGGRDRVVMAVAASQTGEVA